MISPIRHRTLVTLLAALCLLGFVPSLLHAAVPRATFYGVRMDPSDVNARDFARPGWGGGVDLSWPLPGSQGLLSGIAGIEAVSLLSKVKKFQDPLTLLRIEQHTDQMYGRLFVGGELGPHGNGFLEPYANLAVALVFYGISSSVVIPDDSNRENDINQHLGDENEVAFGWSAGTGVNLNFGRWGIDGGVRYLKQYGVPQQLGDGAVTVQPSYLQYRVGVSFAIPH
ncbi:MAG: hypothetical protein ABL977_08720 [Candidatus Eisenbacteria bacterium]